MMLTFLSSNNYSIGKTYSYDKLFLESQTGS